MLVTRVLGDCPSCGGQAKFGNVFVKGNQVLRGCMSCKHKITIALPEVQKKVLYLDQFFFSSAFREGDARFVEAAQRIRQISALQLLVVPFSSIHEDETHQWRGYDDKNKEDLMEFIKSTSRGHEFEPAYEVEQTQIVRAFKAYLAGVSDDFKAEHRDAVHGDIHEWDDYIRIDVGRYMGEIELIRDFKQQSIEGLVDLFPKWRESKNSFEQDVFMETEAAAKGYLDSYIEYAVRIASGDYNALLDSPIMSMVVQSLLFCLSDDIPHENRLQIIGGFFKSAHFSKTPYRWISDRTYAILKDMVKQGAYTNRDKALKRLNGFYQDVKHVATYAPYCDGFVLDQAMASLVSDGRVDIENKYGVKVFSLNNWEQLMEWLDELEAEMSEEHRKGLVAAYP